MTIRAYDKERDRAAALRIWREVGWLEKEPEKEEILDVFLEGADTKVAELEGAAECMVVMTPGDLRYLDRDLRFAGVGAVTTSRIARRQGLAGRTAAAALADAAAAGAAAAGLGMFEQGYYDQLGFGTMSYEHYVSFDPATLRRPPVPRARVPRRLSRDDAAIIHQCRLQRMRGHGAANFDHVNTSLSNILYAEHGFGLGYFDREGVLTHHLWVNGKGEHGPYEVYWLAYQDHEQLLELLGLLHNLSDQVHFVVLREPPGLQLQDLLELPTRHHERTRRAVHEQRISASANYQVRMLDVAACVGAVRVTDSVAFNLELRDPVERYLPDDASWRGCGGSYLVRLADQSAAEPGSDPRLPTLQASVGAFSRVWLGALPATAAAIAGDLTAPAELLANLDHALRLPAPDYDWEF